MLEHDRDEDVCRRWDDLAEQDFTYRMSESEYFHNRQNWWISPYKSGNTGPLRNRSDFNQALSTLNRLHREAGGQQLRSMLDWKYQKMATVIEFFLHLKANGMDLGGFLKNSKKSQRKMHAEVYDRTAHSVVYRPLDNTLDERLSRICSILSQTDLLNWRRSAATNGVCKPQKTVLALWFLQRIWAQVKNSVKWLQRQEFHWRHEHWKSSCLRWCRLVFSCLENDWQHSYCIENLTIEKLTEEDTTWFELESSRTFSDS